MTSKINMFDWKKPTVQMLGRWQPWHKGHQELFKRCFEESITSISATKIRKRLRDEGKLK